MFESDITENWVKPLIPDAINSILQSAGHCCRGRTDALTAPTPIGKFGMNKRTTTGLQTFLNASNNDDDDNGFLEVDGLFGPQTISSLKNFAGNYCVQLDRVEDEALPPPPRRNDVTEEEEQGRIVD
ncbi:hypothetical protein TrLO_g15623 [Triparma laevis f. longispina]|uniref:Uncharacterized protein n=1 Tax=Triparma laevis f. longispina TaxID=1714387 RepID=A0A9W7FQS2_9STRA|nr:hypothetical protein TrLO_g15623 [Triparma laevis f. longispina]